MTVQSVRAHSRRVATARRRGDLPPKFNPEKDCRACFMLFCTPCSRLNNEHGHRFDTGHCKEHCHHKRLWKKLSIPQMIDNRHLRRGDRG